MSESGRSNIEKTNTEESDTEKLGTYRPCREKSCAEKLDTSRPYNIVMIPMGHSNSYLIVSKGQGILVDAGCPGKIKNLEIVLERNNLGFSDIALVVLTHTHYDHVGCLAEIKEKSGAKILAHEKEKEFLEKGMTPFPEGTLWFSKIISRIGNTTMSSKSRYQPVSPDIVVSDGYDLGRYVPHAKIIPTPGHTKGSISLIIENEVAFVGDTLFNAIPGMVFPPFADDVPELLKSWRVLIDSGCRIFYPGHGRPLTFKKLKDSYEKRINI
ncbi:MBL fold metallo-hydrolase [Methanosarcina hadiensis]|uniref:MBL fold metallo-hydrolase n=1 Tax=Methanosarcina hadiensis TaxID=3078083 RepID=UPI003977CEA1